KDNKWPPKSIIQYYGPATWAEDGYWGYCYSHLHTLNHIIRLQAVVKIITNATARALNLLAKQRTKMYNAIYQHCLALDSMLASERDVCGNFNLNICCLQIDDEEKVLEEITDLMGKVAYVPVQSWKG
ncbi:ENR1 protein, partial [Crocuta crocuta]